MAVKPVILRFVGDTKSLDAALASTQGKLGTFGGALMKAGIGIAAIGVATGVALFRVGESFDEAYDQIRTGTGATGKELEGLKATFRDVVRDVPTDFGRAGTAVADLATRTGLTGGALSDLAKRELELSRITNTDVKPLIEATSRMFGDWSISTDKQGAALDGLYRASQATGVGVDELASKVTQYGAPLRNFGFSWEQATALLGKWGKEGVNTEAILGGLRQGLGRLVKAGKDPIKTLADLQEQFRKTPNDAGLARKALEVFGTRAGPDLVSALKEGRFSIAELTGTIAGGKDTILGAGKDTMDFAEKWQMFKNRVLVAIEPIAARVFSGIGKAMDKLGPIVDTLSKAFAEGGLRGVLDKLSTPAKIAAGALLAVGAAVLIAMAPVTAIIAGLGLLAAGLVYCWKHFESFRNVVRGVLDFFKAAWAAAIKWWSDHSDEVIGRVQQVGRVFSGMGATVRDTADIIVTTFKAWFAAVQAVVTRAVAVIRNLWRRFGEQLVDHIRIAWNSIMQVVSGAMEAVRGIIQLVSALIHGDWSKAWDAIGKIFGGVWNMILGTVKWALNLLSAWIGAAMAVISAVWGYVWNGLKNVLAGVWNGIKHVVSAGVSGITGAIGSIVGFITGLGGKVWAAAVGLGGKVLSGLKHGMSAVAGFAGDVASAITGAVKDAWNTVAGKINRFVPDKIGWGPFSLDIPDNPIPTFAKGGIVTQATLGIFGEAGPEAIIPLNRPARAREILAEGGLLQPAAPAAPGLVIQNMTVTALNPREAARQARTEWAWYARTMGY